MIGVAFWAVTLTTLGVGFAAATLFAIVRVMYGFDDEVARYAFAALGLLVIAALCLGGGVSLGTVAWP